MKTQTRAVGAIHIERLRNNQTLSHWCKSYRGFFKIPTRARNPRVPSPPIRTTEYRN